MRAPDHRAACSVAMVCLTACGRFAFDPGATVDSMILDRPDGVDTVDARVLGPFGAPVLVAELSDPGFEDDDPTLTGDLLEIYFNRTAIGVPNTADIWRATRATAASGWDPPAAVPELNTPMRETSPRITPDGLTMFFASDRTGGSGGLDIYTSTRPDRGSLWSTPVRVPELSSAQNDIDAAPRADALVIYRTVATFVAVDEDVLRASRPTNAATWSVSVAVPELQSMNAETGPWVNADDTQLWFASNRGGDVDMWWSQRAITTDPWSVPSRVAELASAASDSDPWLADDLRTIYFSSGRTGGGDIYLATR